MIIDGKIPILMYHQFVKKESDAGKIRTYVTSKRFELHLSILKLLGYETITFKDLENSEMKKSKKKKIILTVDDGYKDNYEIMFPILKKHNAKVVVFCVTGVKHNKWTVESDGEKRFDLLSDKEIKEMNESGLVEFGGHTLSHRSMVIVPPEELEEEIRRNKQEIEEIIGEQVISFAYPYGHNSKRIQKAVEDAGYKYAVSTDSGTGIIWDNLYDIRRVDISCTGLLDFLRKISPDYLVYKYKKKGNKKQFDKYEEQ